VGSRLVVRWTMAIWHRNPSAKRLRNCLVCCYLAAAVVCYVLDDLKSAWMPRGVCIWQNVLTRSIFAPRTRCEASLHMSKKLRATRDEMAIVKEQGAYQTAILWPNDAATTAKKKKKHPKKKRKKKRILAYKLEPSLDGFERPAKIRHCETIPPPERPNARL